MSLNYLEYAKKALNSAVQGLEFRDEAARADFEESLFLRPPKEQSWGDLCTNAPILLKKEKNISFEEAAKPILQAFQKLDQMQSVTVSSNGYLNLRYAPSYWQESLPRLCHEMSNFGFEKVSAQKRDVLIEVPDKVQDLVEARRQANGEILEQLAVIAGWQFRKEPGPPHEAETMALEPVVAKCGKYNTRFALIANPPAFTKAFSLNLAIDKSYDNPVFCIPYARQMTRKLTAGVDAGEGEGQAPDLSVLEGTVELKLTKLLCHWPLAVERSLEKQDVFYLTSFLQDISLLFFQLVEAVRPVSSDYLHEHGKSAARLYLLKSVDTVLTGALDILGIPAKKEFE
ncbi:MAG: DALR anticodon-binding domain-containing protein [Proteobacteria bacterium]|nr:DALR anticodon-binding domain-containing protein [Pseudomonadota bacterium]